MFKPGDIVKKSGERAVALWDSPGYKNYRCVRQAEENELFIVISIVTSGDGIASTIIEEAMLLTHDCNVGWCSVSNLEGVIA